MAIKEYYAQPDEYFTYFKIYLMFMNISPECINVPGVGSPGTGIPELPCGC